MDPINNPGYNIRVYLNKEAMFKELEEQTDADVKITILPIAEADLMIGDLCEEFQNQDIYFSEFENDCYEGANLRHLYDVLSGYKEQLPVLYGEVKKAYELDTLALLCL